MSWSQIDTFKRDPQGRVYFNPAKDYLRPFELTLDKPNSVVTLNPGETLGPFALTAQRDGPIEVFYVKANVYDASDNPLTTYDVDFLLEHAGKRKIFSNRPVPLMAASGDGGRPYILPETIFIPAVQSVQVTFFNRDSATRKVEFVLGGIKFYPNAAPKAVGDEMWAYAQRRERTYAYWQLPDREIVLPPSGELDAVATVPDDADLEIFKLSARSASPFRIEIIEGITSRSLFNGSLIHGSLVFGGHVAVPIAGGLGGSGGVFPSRWATSWVVRRSTQILFRFENLAASNNRVSVVLGGRKISYAG